MGGWSTPRPVRFTSRKEILYPLYRRLGGPQGRSGRLWKISPPTEIRSPDRPARSESLYRLSYPGPAFKTVLAFKVKMTLDVWMQVSTAIVFLIPSTNYENIKQIINVGLHRNSVIRKFNVTWPLSLIHFIQQSTYTNSDSVKYDLLHRYRPRNECYNRRHICALRCALYKLRCREWRYSWHLQRKASTKWNA